VHHIYARLISELDGKWRAEMALNNDDSIADVPMARVTADNVDDHRFPASECRPSSGQSCSGTIWSTLGPLIKTETEGMYTLVAEERERLPTFTRLLLVAAYCCSYNPPKFDTRLLVKVRHRGGSPWSQARTTSGRAPRAHYAGVESNDSLHNRGAAIVPLNRLTHAFR